MKYFFIFFPHIFYVMKNYGPLGHIAHLRKFQSINTFAQSYIYTIWLNKREKKDIISFWRIEWSFTFKSLSLLGRSLLWTNLNPFTQGCFLPRFVEIGPVVLEKKTKMSNVYDDNNDNYTKTTTITMNNGQNVI